MDDDALYVSAVTVMEAWKGLSKARKTSADDPDRLSECGRYEEAFDKLVETFSDRVVPIDEPIAKLWGKILGTQDKNRFDVCLAATAITLGMVIATRNTKDFLGRGALVVDPFRKSSCIEKPSS